MATATVIPRTVAPSPRQRKHARELARLERAASIYQRHSGIAINDTADPYAWYRSYLADNFPSPGWGC
jgi:hypothetical protein